MANNIDGELKLSQQERILKWFETHDSLTRWETYEFLGMWEAPARISELKKQGYNFITKLESGVSKYGYKYTSAVWTLER